MGRRLVSLGRCNALVLFQVLDLVVHLQVVVNRVGCVDRLLAGGQRAQEAPVILSFFAWVVLRHVLLLVLSKLDGDNLDNLRRQCFFELGELNFTITLALDTSNDGNELVVTCVKLPLVAEAVEVEVRDEALLLAVKQVEGGLVVPVGQLGELVLQHLVFNMKVQFPLEEISEALFNGFMESLAVTGVQLESLPLAHILTQLGVHGGKYEFKELRVLKTARVVEVVEEEKQLHVFHRELLPVVVLQEAVDVHHVNLLVAISVQATEGCVGLKIVEVGKVLANLLNTQLQVGKVPEIVCQFLLGLNSQHLII